MNNNNQPRRRNVYPGARKKMPASSDNNTQNSQVTEGARKAPKTISPREGARPEKNQSPQTPKAGRPRPINPIEAARRKKEKKLLAYIAAALLLLLAIVTAFAARALGIRENKNDFTIVMGSKVKVAYTDIVRDGSLYLNAASLAFFCDMTISGSYDELKLSSDSGAYAIFVPGSKEADVNGTHLTMPAPAILEGNTLWLPCDFVSSTFVGLSITVDRTVNKITIERTKLEGSTSEKPIYADITFTVSGLPAGAKDKILEEIKGYTFLTDISAYSEYLNPEDDSRYLLLVNKASANSLPENYIPSPLAKISNSLTLYGGEIELEAGAERALTAMFAEMRVAGFADIFVSSGYRSWAKQSVLFNTYVSREMEADKSLTIGEATEKVKTYSAVAGTSEHQSGLCVDLISSTMSDLDLTFADHPVFEWLKENAHKFGFILRYPENKVTATGYQYEPWHYRFVGQYHAAAMIKSGMCLEEYIYSISQNN